MNKQIIHGLMLEAIKQARLAKNAGEVPIGAVITDANFNIVSYGKNQIEGNKFVGSHAEMIAMEIACKKISNWRLNGYKLFVTLEPCLMCSSALILSRISEIYYGCSDSRLGGTGSILNICNNDKLPHQISVTGDIMEEECRTLLQDFFKEIRKNHSRTSLNV